MSYREKAVVFDCGNDALLGIVSQPAPGANCDAFDSHVGVLIVVGGPQYRAGSHRMFTLLARALAQAGYPTLRFDYRGMGDSTGAQRNFQRVSHDIRAAIDALQEHVPQVRRVVLWGLCDGASAALLYLHDSSDVRVRGLALANPWVRSEASLARAHLRHYYLQRLRQSGFWRKLLAGGVAGHALAELWRNLGRASRQAPPAQGSRDSIMEKAATYQHRMSIAADRFDGKLLLMLSGNDLTAREFTDHSALTRRWMSVLGRHNCVVHCPQHADHTFSDPDEFQSIATFSTRWLARA